MDVEEKGLESDAVVKGMDARFPGLSRKLIYLAIFVVVALVSFFALAQFASSPDTYSGTIETLDEKKANVMALMTSTTAASAAVTLLPGDIGTPIANKLVDLSSDFLIILAVIYLEKFLLTTIGYTAFAFLVPAACALLAISLFTGEDSSAKGTMRGLGIKLAAFGLAMVFVIPVSVWVSDSIDNSFEASLEAANSATQEATDAISSETQELANEESSFIDGILEGAQNGWDSLTQGAQGALDSLGANLNTIIDTLAVMIVTSCLIPILVLAFFFWLVNAITGLNIGTSRGAFQSGRKRARSVANEFRGN